MRQTVPAANLGAAHENVSFRTSDGLELQGWYVPSKNGAAVIAFPGRSGSQAHTRMLASHGYGVAALRPPRRGQERGRQQPARLGRRQGHPRRDRVPQGPPGRRSGQDRRNRPLCRRRADAADRSRDRRARAAVVSEGAGTRQFSEQMEEFHGWERAERTGFLLVTAGTARLLQHRPASEPDRRRPEDQAAALRDLGAERRQHRAHEQGVLPAREQQLEADLGDADRQARRRHPRPAEGSTSARVVGFFDDVAPRGLAT